MEKKRPARIQVVTPKKMSGAVCFTNGHRPSPVIV